MPLVSSLCLHLALTPPNPADACNPILLSQCYISDCTQVINLGDESLMSDQQFVIYAVSKSDI